MSDDAEVLGPESFVWDGDWALISSDPYTGRQVWHLDMGSHIIIKTTYPMINELLDHNGQIRSATAGQRWGDGKLVASVPEHIYFRELAEARKQEDKAYIKKWLNNSDHAAFRTFEGKV